MAVPAVDNGIVDLEVVRLKEGLSPRTRGIDPGHVETLTGVFELLPPIVVHASTMKVIDGAHRVAAARRLGAPLIRAQLWDGEDNGAVAEAIRLNVAHGKPLSKADRDAAVGRIVRCQPDWSNRRIAAVCGVSQSVVASRRVALGGNGVDRVGLDGRRRPSDPAGARQRVLELMLRDPGQSDRALSRNAGVSPATVRAVREQLTADVPVIPSALLSPETPTTPTVPPTKLEDEAAFGSDPQLARFAKWFDRTAILQADWEVVIDIVPQSRVYEVADEARRRSVAWSTFAARLESALGRARL